MSFSDSIYGVFPRVDSWIGQSEIHVSISKSTVVGLLNPDTAMILKVMKSTQTPELMYQKFVYLFEGVEWLVDEDTFSKLLLVLLKYQLEYKVFETPDMIQNPVTGNYFHRIALYPAHNLVLGFRCWIDVHSDSFKFGWRLRVTRLDNEEEEKKVRVEVTRRQQIVLEEIEGVYDLIAEIPEPKVDEEELVCLYNYNTEIFGDE